MGVDAVVTRASIRGEILFLLSLGESVETEGLERLDL